MRFRTSRDAAAAAVLALAFLAGADWTQFRGPGGLGKDTAARGLPTSWSSTENVVWKTELPGLGSSSPVVLGDRIYLTCYSGYAESVDEPGEMEDLMRHMVCLKRDGGAVVWQKQFEPELPESRYRAGTDSLHGYSSSTPATDGERLYVFFGRSGVYCLDLEGNQLWHADVGERTRGWGSSNSPVLYQNLVIVNASVESGELVGLNKSTGERVWTYKGMRGSWNTPLLVEVPDGGTEMVFCLPRKIVGIDPATGEELWTSEGIPDGGYVCPSPVAHEGVVYAIGGRTNTALAVRAGGRGDVTETHLLWETNKGSNVASPVYHDGHLYWFHEGRGIAYCLNAEDGEVVYEGRLTPRYRRMYASVTLADGKLYCISQYAGAYVVAASPEFELLAHNKFEEDDSRSNASPVVHNNQLLLRTDRYLYCIGE